MTEHYEMIKWNLRLSSNVKCYLIRRSNIQWLLA